MRKNYIMFLFAAMALLAGCAKEEVKAPVGDGHSLTISLSQTKTHMDGESGTTHKIYWSNNDKIAVNGNVSDALSGLGETESTATFHFETPLSSTPYNIVYPASIYKNETTVTLPVKQSYKDGGFADGMFPMAGYSADGSSVSINYLCAIVKVAVKRSSAVDADTDNLVSVTFKGRNNEQVSGDFTIDCSAATLTGASSAAADKEVRVIKELETSTTEDAVYYIVVPAQNYTNGISIIVQDVNGDAMTIESGAANLAAGKLYTPAAIVFEPDGTTTGINIANAQDLIDFATAYNNKEYDALGSSLVANLTADITFDATSSAAFNATKGIGLKINYFGDAEDKYFDGLFNGNNHTISGLTATTPIFKATSATGKIKDLTIDNTCSFTFTHNDSSEMDAGAVVGYHRGELDHVTVAANVAVAAGSVSKITALGGLVGRVVVGSVDNCSFTGDLVVPEDYVVDNQKTYIGGLVGETTNADGEINDSNFAGIIDFAGIVASTDRSNPYLFVGGIVGSNAGTVSGSSTLSTRTKAITMDNNKEYTATIQNHSRKAFFVAQGGIAGQNSGTISNCTNGASIMNFILSNATKGGTAADANSRYYDLGGIVGLNLAEGTVTKSNNNSLIESRCTPRIQKIGGVVGYNKGDVSSCYNLATGATDGDIYITTTNVSPYSVRVGEIGGVIGNNSGTVSDLYNASKIYLDRTENAAGVELKIGGVIGLTTTAIDGGVGQFIANNGIVQTAYNGTTVTTDGLRIGGVVGSAQASVQNVLNSGSVTYKTSSTNAVSKLYMGGIVGEIRDDAAAVLSGCRNSGEVYFNVANNAAHTDNYVGGIIGKINRTAIKEEDVIVGYKECNLSISNCTNTGYIHGGNSTKQNGKTLFLGGIIAHLDGISSITDCENTGVQLNNQFNNTNTKVGSTFEGGIAGFVEGTEDHRIAISNVTNDLTSLDTTTGGRRGYTGGIVGYGEYVDITNASNADSYGGGSGYWIGGIAGWIVNSTISGCTYSGTSIETSQVQGAGGIVCVLGAGSTVNNCNSYLTTITHGANACVDGAVAGKSEATSTISNCHYKSAYPICSDTNFTDGGGNVADL